MSNEDNKYSVVEVKNGSPEEQDISMEKYCADTGNEVHSVDRVGTYSVYILKQKLQ